MVTAIANPNLDILGHCTGRIVVGRGRPESTFDAEAVFAAAVEHGKAVEVNCRPERLDPPRRLLRKAVDAGCKVSIDTDAHSTGEFGLIPYGISVARRAWLTPKNVLNCQPLASIKKFIAAKRDR